MLLNCFEYVKDKVVDKTTHTLGFFIDVNDLIDTENYFSLQDFVTVSFNSKIGELLVQGNVVSFKYSMELDYDINCNLILEYKDV